MTDPVENSVFNNEQPAAPAAPAPVVVDNSTPVAQPTDSFGEILKGITTESGRQKYLDPVSALESIAPAQEHIGSLEEENRTLRTELDKRKSVEAAIGDFKTSTNGTETTSVPLDASKIDEIVDARMSQVEVQAQNTANTKAVTDAMTTKFGEKAEEEFYNRASRLGMSKDQINKLAATSPVAALQVVGIEAVVNQPAPSKTTSTINMENLSPVEQPLSAKIPVVGSTTKDTTRAWLNTKEIVDKRNMG